MSEEILKPNYLRKLILETIIVKDGDTLEATIDLGFESLLTNQVFRLYGVNAYETTRRGKWDDGLSEEEIQEKLQLGKDAELLLQSKVWTADEVWYDSKISPKDLRKKGKYGRWLGTLYIYSEGEILNWNKFLVEQGYGFDS